MLDDGPQFADDRAIDEEILVTEPNAVLRAASAELPPRCQRLGGCVAPGPHPYIGTPVHRVRGGRGLAARADHPARPGTLETHTAAGATTSPAGETGCFTVEPIPAPPVPAMVRYHGQWRRAGRVDRPITGRWGPARPASPQTPADNRAGQAPNATKQCPLASASGPPPAFRCNDDLGALLLIELLDGVGKALGSAILMAHDPATTALST